MKKALGKKGFTPVKTILMPTDFSPYSDRALNYGATLAKRLGAKVILMHVIESFPYSVTDTLNIVKHTEALRKIAGTLLENSSEGLREQGLAVQTYLAEGTAYREIVKKAGQEGVEMIVMGSHGRTGVERLIMGSVAEKVVRLARCPVLTVRPGWQRAGERRRGAAKKGTIS